MTSTTINIMMAIFVIYSDCFLVKADLKKILKKSGLSPSIIFLTPKIQGISGIIFFSYFSPLQPCEGMM